MILWLKVLNKHLRLLARYWVITFEEFSSFTWDVWLSVIQFVLYIGRSIVFWWAVSRIGVFGGWTLPELSFFAAISFLPGLHELFWNFWNRASFSDKVLRGDLDKYLARPVHPLFAIAAEDVHLAMFLKYFVPPLVMAICLVRGYHLPVTMGRFLVGYLLLSTGKFVLTMMRAASSMLAFKYGDVTGLQLLLFQFTALGRYPVDAFPSTLKFLLTYVLPAGFTATFPAMVMLGKAAGLEVFGVAAVLAFLWAFIVLRLWAVMVSSYESFGG